MIPYCRTILSDGWSAEVPADNGIVVPRANQQAGFGEFAEEQRGFSGARISRHAGAVCADRHANYYAQASVINRSWGNREWWENSLAFCELLIFLYSSQVRTKDRIFESISHLINYHWTNRLPIISAESALLLCTPIIRTHDIKWNTRKSEEDWLRTAAEPNDRTMHQAAQHSFHGDGTRERRQNRDEEAYEDDLFHLVEFTR